MSDKEFKIFKRVCELRMVYEIDNPEVGFGPFPIDVILLEAAKLQLACTDEQMNELIRILLNLR